MYVQETKWKSRKAGSVVSRKRNGLGGILNEEYAKKVIEVKRLNV